MGTTVTAEPTRRIPQPFGPDEHKAARQQLNVARVDDLLAQTRVSDPFYRGGPADQEKAEWFAQLLVTVDLAHHGTHLRRVHYRADALAAERGITFPDGELYRNDAKCWQRLKVAALPARQLGLVDPEWFVDRRNPDMVVNRWQRDDDVSEPWARANPGELRELPPSLVALPGFAASSLPTAEALQVLTPADRWMDVEVYGYDYHRDDQPVLLEVWCEKSTMDDILVPVARTLGANYVGSKGTQSMTSAIELLRRAERHDRPAHILYVSDHDHVGRHIPVSVARDVQYWRDKLDITQPVSVDNLVLTADQVAEYRLPRDPERGNATELDALEALRPGALAGIVSDAGAQFIDSDLKRRLDAARSEGKAVATRQLRDALADVLDSRDQLISDVAQVDLDRYRQPIAEHVAALLQLEAQLHEEMEPYRERRDELERQAAEIVDEFDPELPERPAAVTVEPPERVLYDSRRGWLDQLDAYQAHRNGGGRA